jgi:uncharacterized protein YndB with AHSA1/START domain
MAPIVHSVEIARSPADVFAYLDELDRHGEWQGQLVSVEVETEGPTRVGSRAKETRKVPGGPQTYTYEITEHDPPRKASFRVLDGPVRAFGTMTVEPAGEGSRLTIRIDFEGHGLGKLIVPIARRNARKQVPQDQVRLKERLESGS